MAGPADDDRLGHAHQQNEVGPDGSRGLTTRGIGARMSAPDGTREVPSINEARAGDWIKATYEGRPFEGPAFVDGTGDLRVGGTYLTINRVPVTEVVNVLSVTRAVPVLPTENGEVIANVLTVDGDRFARGMRAVMHHADDKPWLVVNDTTVKWLRASDIVDFTTTSVVAK